MSRVSADANTSIAAAAAAAAAATTTTTPRATLTRNGTDDS